MVLFEVNKRKQKKPSENLLLKQIFNFIRLSRTFEMKLIAIQKISCKNLKTKNNAQKKQKKYNEEKPGSFRGPKLWTRPWILSSEKPIVMHLRRVNFEFFSSYGESFQANFFTYFITANLNISFSHVQWDFTISEEGICKSQKIKWYVLCDFVPFVQFKKREKQLWRSITWGVTLLGCFSLFLNCKCYQIA